MHVYHHIRTFNTLVALMLIYEIVIQSMDLLGKPKIEAKNATIAALIKICVKSFLIYKSSFKLWLHYTFMLE